MSLNLETWLAPVIEGVRLLPVLHDRVDVAGVVRSVLDELEPAAVAVELPTTLRAPVSQAVRRLPQMSLVISELDGEPALVWPCAPAEPFACALRWADERAKPYDLIDPDISYAKRHHEPVPDPYALLRLGPKAYFGAVVEMLAATPRAMSELGAEGNIASETANDSDADRIREQGMAHHIQIFKKRQAGDGDLLVLVGAAHIPGITRYLAGPTPVPFARTRRAQVELRNLHPESLTGVLPDAPIAHACFELARASTPSELSRMNASADFEALKATTGRKVSFSRHGLQLLTGIEPDEDKKRPMRRVRFATGASCQEVSGHGKPDRVALGVSVFRMAAASYESSTHESLAPWQERLYFDYARRYARIQGQLVPNLLEWTVAARGVADDNFAWEIFDVARTYPWQQETAEIPTVRVDGEELDLGTRKIRFRKRQFRVKKRFVPVKARPTVADPSEWLEAFEGGGICSHRPEDVVIEDYGSFLQKKAVSILSAERSRSEPFTTSMLDGIDIRETLRNVIDDKIYVREMGRAPGDAGSVVIIFDQDPTGAAYPYCMTWLGEHAQESDMAFYSTEPTEQVVGPGIMRATYGALMMTYPPRRLFDVWQDSDYRQAETKSEVLLMAGIDYSEEKIVAHLASSAPSESMRRYAAKRGKRIVHIPLGSMSPVTVKRIRVLHILAGYDKREVAKDYIW